MNNNVRLNTTGGYIGNHYNTINSNTLANELVNLKINNHHRLLTLDIKDLYVNIPIQETLDITEAQLNAHNDQKTTYQIVTLLNTILWQNYFSFHGQINQPNKGVAMGSPISGTTAEIFLQKLENSFIKHLTDTRILSFYTRYVDDILLIYDSTRTSPDNILQYINTIHNNITLNPTMESANTINFLDLSITRKPTHLNTSIFHKPTSTDTTINFLSNHPLEHKLAAYLYLIHRLYTPPLCKEQQDRE